MEKLGKLTFRLATERDRTLVEQFCKSEIYSNNISLEAMKWEWCLRNGAWTVAIHEDKIISLSLIHI